MLHSTLFWARIDEHSLHGIIMISSMLSGKLCCETQADLVHDSVGKPVTTKPSARWLLHQDAIDSLYYSVPPVALLCTTHVVMSPPLKPQQLDPFHVSSKPEPTNHPTHFAVCKYTRRVLVVLSLNL